MTQAADDQCRASPKVCLDVLTARSPGACVSIQFGALEWSKRFFSERNGGKELGLRESSGVTVREGVQRPMLVWR